MTEEHRIPVYKPTLQLRISRHKAFVTRSGRPPQRQVNVVYGGMKTPRTPVTASVSSVHGLINIARAVEQAIRYEIIRIELVLSPQKSDAIAADIIGQQRETRAPAGLMTAIAYRAYPVGAVILPNRVWRNSDCERDLHSHPPHRPTRVEKHPRDVLGQHPGIIRPLLDGRRRNGRLQIVAVIVAEVPETCRFVKLAEPYEGVLDRFPSNLQAIDLCIVGRSGTLSQ